MSARPNPVRDAALAVSLLTVVPTPAQWTDEGPRDVAGWFPAVGLLIGGVAWGLGRAAVLLGLNAAHPAVVAALLLLVTALLTRFLHYDGLADVADAWWGGADVPRRLEIMKDSATGAFGVTAVAFAIVIATVAVSDIVESGVIWPLLVIPALSRSAATFAAWLGSPARDGGLGRSVMTRPGIAGMLPFGAVVAGVCAFCWLSGGVVGLALAGIGVVAALVTPHLVSARFGGVTGDVMGASTLIVETFLFFVALGVVR